MALLATTHARTGAVVLFALLLTAPPLAAAGLRAHALTRSLTKRLSAPARKNAAAVGHLHQDLAPYGRIGNATAFLVHVDGRRALAMTNWHVVTLVNRVAARFGMAAEARTALITLPNGSKAKIRGVIASSRYLDYALVSLDLPRRGAATPVTLSAEPAAGRTYMISGYGNHVRDDGMENLVVAPRDRDELDRAILRGRGAPTISSGETFELSALRRWLYKLQLPTRPHLAFFDYTSVPGQSGSPVFSAASHRVVALVVGRTNEGGPAAGTPMALILRDLRRKIARREIPESDRVSVRGLLDAAGAP